MRSLGVPELLVVVALLALLLGGARISRLFERLGRRLRTTVSKVKWICQTVIGTEEEEIRAEEEAGAKLAAEFLRQMPPDPDENVQGLVKRVGGRLAETPEAKKRRFVFQVVRGAVANAYSLPGGHVFVTRMLVDLCGGDEHETAFLIAHEMGHVVCRHPSEGEWVDILSRVVRVGPVASELFGKGYSREQELEADLKAVDLAGEAGFDREAGLRVLRKLDPVALKASGFGQYFATHPGAEERLECVEEHLNSRRYGTQ